MNYDKYFTDTVKHIKPSGIRKFFDAASIYKDVVSLGVGEPDFDTPWTAREAAIRSIRSGFTHYTANSGLIKLREEIARYMSVRFDLKYDPKDEIFVTVGASEPIYLMLRTFVGEGDEVVVPDPSYVSYAPSVELCGGKAVSAKCRAEDSFALTPSALEEAITPRTKVLILPYPNNPTGAIMTGPQLKAIADIVKKHDLFVLSDEIYAELTYGGKHVSIATLEGMRERTVVINGFSKAFAMTGWRLGFVCAPREVEKQMLKIHQYIIMCAPTSAQYAGLQMLKSAFEDNFSAVEEMREEYNVRRRFLVDKLNKMGLTCFEPRGAFYVFPCVRSTGMDGEQFAERLIESKKVAVVPGGAFGESGKDFVRISYAYSLSDLKKAMDRIEEFVNELSQSK